MASTREEGLAKSRASPIDQALLSLVKLKLDDAAPCYVSVQDPDFRIVHANRRFVEAFGEATGRRCYEVYKGLTSRCEVCPVAETFTDGRTHSSEETVRSKNGDVINMIVYTAPIRAEGGEILAVVEMSTDVTELKRVESQLEVSTQQSRLLFDEAPCYISVQDRDGHILEANRRYQDDFGPPTDAMCYQAYKNRTEPCETCPVARTFADGQVHASEGIVTSSDGEPLNVLVRTAPLYNADGDIERVIKMSTNITQMRQMEARLVALGQLVSSIAHSIKSTVTGLEGGIYLVNSGFKREDDQRVRQGWDVVQRNVERVSRMVLDILFCAKDRPPRREKLSARKTAREVYKLFEEKAKQRRVKIVLDLDTDPCDMEADPQALHAMLVGLVENGMDACLLVDDEEPRGHSVTLSVLPDGDYVLFRVSDDGVGIDEEAAMSLFTAFSSTKAGGTGLGLLVAQKAVTEHGGTIQASPTPGGGATFTARLPRVAPVEEN